MKHVYWGVFYGKNRGKSAYENLATEWLRAMRGDRSQLALSRRLGYRSNIAYRWEAGHCWPSSAKTFSILQRLGSNIAKDLRTFYRQPPAWLGTSDLTSTQGVARLLQDLRGTASIVSLSAATGLNRFSISRWLNGAADPPLPALLSLVEACTFRVLDFVAAFTDPSKLKSVSKVWQQRQAARETAYTHPWSQAVLRALELHEYQNLPVHDTPWLAAQLGSTLHETQQALDVLQRTRQIRRKGSHYELVSVRALDTRADPQRAREVKAHWSRLAVQRLEQGDEGLFSYNISVVSKADLQRLQELQRAHYREMSRIIAASQPADCVVLYNAQLFGLSETKPSPS